MARKRFLSLVVKIACTVGIFYLLLTHTIETNAAGNKASVLTAMQQELSRVSLRTALPWLVLATSLKALGIFSSMVRWSLLLIAQGIRFNFSHIAGSFLIGRFLGTFLPSTIGLDAYKLYDAAKFSGNTVKPAAATVIEKILGFAGVMLTFLLLLPLGYSVFGENLGLVLKIALPLCFFLLLPVIVLLLYPAVFLGMFSCQPQFGKLHFQQTLVRIKEALFAYQGQYRLLCLALALSTCVHLTTASMYYFTALSIGAHHADFFQVTLASTVQILATVLFPLTVAGEGVREVVQALLLTKHLGASVSILSAALGFWAAEALTLVGGIIWWLRRENYQPQINVKN